MHQFTDKNGDTWELELTIGKCERVLSALDIDLLDPISGTPPLMVRLSFATSDGIRLFVNTLYVLCAKQCEKREMSDVDFGENLGPEALFTSFNAFLQEWSDFFQSLGRKETVRALAKFKTALETNSEVAADMMDDLDVSKEGMARDLKAVMLKQSGSLPESLASTPGS